MKNITTTLFIIISSFTYGVSSAYAVDCKALGYDVDQCYDACKLVVWDPFIYYPCL